MLMLQVLRTHVAACWTSSWALYWRPL